MSDLYVCIYVYIYIYIYTYIYKDDVIKTQREIDDHKQVLERERENHHTQINNHNLEMERLRNDMNALREDQSRERERCEREMIEVREMIEKGERKVREM